MHRYNHHIWQKNLDALEKLVLLYLLDRANQEGVCWPSITTIAASTGLARRTVLKVLGELERKGYLARERTGMTNTYRLNLSQVASPEASPETSASGALDSAPHAPTSASGAPGSASGALGSASHAPGSAPGALGVVHEVHQVVHVVHQVVHVVHPNQTKNQTVEPNIELPPPPIVPPQNSDRRQEEEEVEEVKAKKAEPENLKTPSPSPEKRSDGASQAIPAARSGAVPVGAVLASMGGRFHSPEPPEEMVRALKGAGVWERLASLRRYARDQRAWLEWLAGPLAAMWRSAPEAFPAAIGEALDALASRPEVKDPLSYLLAVARKRLTPNGEATRSEEDPAARALRLLREGQEPSGEDLVELLRQRGVPTKAGLGRYNGMSADGEWVYARLGGDIIAVSKREAIRRLVDGGHEEVAHVG